MKKVLITNIEIVQYSGSEINCLTIAKRFKQIGYEVYIGALDFGEPLINETKDLGFNFINLIENKFDFFNIEFDIVWAQHSFLLDWLIFDKNINAKKIITSSLSPKEVFEGISLYANSLNLILANSMETKEVLEQEGAKNVVLFENYSYEDYFKINNEVKELKNIAVVSNHIPPEEKEAIKILQDKGYKVDVYGLEGKKVFITDEVLTKYDVVVTIGKTVQYAMSLSIPVYIYDIHGGPGFLKMENIEKCREKNFSGRGYEKKTAIQICEEIETNFNDILKEKDEIKEYAYENFCFEKIFDFIINKLEQTPDINLNKIKEEYAPFVRNIKVSKKVTDYIIGRYNKIINHKEEDIRLLKEEIEKKENQIMNIKNSKVYKLYEKFEKFFARGEK